MNNIIFKEDMLDICIYNLFENNNLSNDDKKKKILELALEYNVNEKSIEERYFWLKNMNINPNEIHLKENHTIVYEIFDKCNQMLNDNNIEYYYTSGILAYLLVNKTLERYHHDLDIFVNIKDLKKLEMICNNYNFSFYRKIGDRGDGTKRVMLKIYYNEMIELPITIFMYIKEKDGSVIQNDYFIDSSGNHYVEKMYNSPITTELSFSSIPYYHNNIKYFSITLEALYLSKVGNRPKDIYDCNIFLDEVNNEKLTKLKEALRKNKDNEIYDAKDDNYYDFIFSDLDYERKLLKK